MGRNIQEGIISKFSWCQKRLACLVPLQTPPSPLRAWSDLFHLMPNNHCHLENFNPLPLDKTCSSFWHDNFEMVPKTYFSEWWLSPRVGHRNCPKHDWGDFSLYSACLFITKVDICSQNCHLCYQNRLNGSQTRLPQNANFEPWDGMTMVSVCHGSDLNNGSMVSCTYLQWCLKFSWMV
jgi:hypothetical protein